MVTRCEIGQVRVVRNEQEYTILGPGSDGDAAELPPDEVRDFVRFDDRGRYRPLTGARTLPGGWRCACADGAKAAAVVEDIYPLAIRHRQQWDAGTLRSVGLDAVLERQTGRYGSARELSPAGREAATDVLCARCVRVPVWRGDPPAAGEIPCPEPCSVLVSLCREAAAWERDPPATATADPAVAFAAFETPGNEVREAFLAARWPQERAGG